MCSGVSSSTRGVRAGGQVDPSQTNTDTIDFVTFAKKTEITKIMAFSQVEANKFSNNTMIVFSTLK